MTDIFKSTRRLAGVIYATWHRPLVAFQLDQPDRRSSSSTQKAEISNPHLAQVANLSHSSETIDEERAEWVENPSLVNSVCSFI